MNSLFAYWPKPLTYKIILLSVVISKTITTNILHILHYTSDFHHYPPQKPKKQSKSLHLNLPQKISTARAPRISFLCPRATVWSWALSRCFCAVFCRDRRFSDWMDDASMDVFLKMKHVKILDDLRMVPSWCWFLL